MDGRANPLMDRKIRKVAGICWGCASWNGCSGRATHNCWMWCSLLSFVCSCSVLVVVAVLVAFVVVAVVVVAAVAFVVVLVMW